MHTPLASLYQLKKCSISSRGRIYSVSGNPKIFLTIIDHLPDSSKKLIPIDNKILKRKQFDLFQPL